MKKFAVLLLTALLALAAGAATAENEKPAASPSAETAWPELESVRALLDDDIQRIEAATYTEGGLYKMVAREMSSTSPWTMTASRSVVTIRSGSSRNRQR